MLDKLLAICRGFNRRFPDGYNPYQIMTRLLEESGELAKEVSHFEGRLRNMAYPINLNWQKKFVKRWVAHCQQQYIMMSKGN
jgi:NTP pyrophosphatase (non-canonical NTP hydrolase)